MSLTPVADDTPAAARRCRLFSRQGKARRAVWGLLLCLLGPGSALARFEPLVFFDSRDLCPYAFLDQGQLRNANVDLVQAVARVTRRSVEPWLLDWNKAQTHVWVGECQKLTFLGRTAKREQHLAFSQPTAAVSFALRTRAEDAHRGLAIGVTHAGLERIHLAAAHPGARLVKLTNLAEGTQKLIRREIDALATQGWSELPQRVRHPWHREAARVPALRGQHHGTPRRGSTAGANRQGAVAEQGLGLFRSYPQPLVMHQAPLVSQRLAMTLGLLAMLVVLAMLVLVLMALLLWQRRQRRAMACEIEQRHQLEQALRERERQLQAANHAKDRFLATVAHELRSPLALLLNAARVIEAKGGTVPEMHWVRSVVERQTRHLARLVDDLLDMGCIKSGKLALRWERVELAAVVADAIEVCRPRLEAAGHRFAQSLPDAPVWLKADQGRLAQVLINLLDNAIKYTPYPGRIELKAWLEDSLVISVRDDGTGIDASQLEAVFEPFHQEARSLAQAGGGLGIGLWLSRGLVELHGGTLTAYSNGPNQGSEFTIRLPVAGTADLSFASQSFPNEV
jgi:signal transduction histidine kinase